MIRGLNRAPAHIQQAALAMLALYRHRELNARRSKKQHYLTLAIGLRWRLLSRDEGDSWTLMSHSDYNTRIDR